MSISLDEMAPIVKRLEARWPGCTVGRPQGGTYHEVRTAGGELIVAHLDLGACLRAAGVLAKTPTPKGPGR